MAAPSPRTGNRHIPVQRYRDGRVTSEQYADHGTNHHGHDTAAQRPPQPVAQQFETVAAAAHGGDVIVAATALQVAHSVAEVRGILPYIFAAFAPTVLPSPHHAPPPVPGRALAPATADNGELWAQNAARFNDMFGPVLNAQRAAVGLAPVSDVRSHIFTDRPWLAADPILAPWPDPADQAVVQTGAWILPDERPLSPELETFLASCQSKRHTSGTVIGSRARAAP